MDKQELDKIEKIKQQCKEFFELLDNDHVPDPSITIIHTRAEMDEYCGRKTEDWVRATSRKRGIAIIPDDVVEDITPHRKGSFDRTLKHEFNHWYLSHITGEFGGKPRWFTEGLANYFAGYKPEAPKMSNDLVVEKYFSFTDRETYRWGYVMVEYMFKKFGKEEIIDFIKKFHNGITQDIFNTTFYEKFGITPEDLEESIKKEFSTSLEQ